MANRQITFRVATGSAFGLNRNQYGQKYMLEASLHDNLTTEQIIQALLVEQFIHPADTSQFAFRLVPVSRSLSFDPTHTSRVLDGSEDLSHEQSKDLMRLWQDEKEHYRRSPNPPLMPGHQLREEYATHMYEPIVFVEGIRRAFLSEWKQLFPGRSRWGDLIGWYEPLPLSESEQAVLKQRFQVLRFTHVFDKETVPVSENGTRGIYIDPVGIISLLGSIASVAQVMLMVGDMWAKKVKGKAVGKTKQGEKDVHPWDEVKAIHVLMSDGTSVQFDTWMDGPEKVKSFVKTFHPASQSPKPLWVSFLLKNGTQVRLDISEGAANHEELDIFISYLKL